MEFFSNLWAWIVANKDAIVTFVTSSSFIGFVTTIIMLVRQVKAVKANTGSTKELKVSLAENKQVIAEMTALKTSVDEIKSEIDNLADTANTLLTKENAVLEVLNVVYNHSIKDEKTRTTVNALLTNAKFAETEARAAILKEVEDLRAQLAQGQAVAEKSVAKVKKIVNVANEQPAVVLRG